MCAAADSPLSEPYCPNLRLCKWLGLLDRHPYHGWRKYAIIDRGVDARDREDYVKLRSVSLLTVTLVACLVLQVGLMAARNLDDPVAAEQSREDQAQCASGKPALPPEPGPFGRLLNEKNFVGPGILRAGDRTDEGGRQAVGEFCLPGDFQPARAILVVVGRLARDYPKLLAEIVSLARKRVSVVSLVSTPAERDKVLRVLASAGLPPNTVRFVRVPTNTIWVRDFGPIFVKRSDGAKVAIDVEYEKDGRRQDNDAAAAVAAHLEVPVLYAPILLEGGSLLSNGRGLCVTTAVAVNRNISRGYDLATIRKLFRKNFGIRRIVLLEPLRGETTGHPDMFACFTDPRTIVVGAYPRAVDPVNAAVLDRNAALLAKVQVAGGKLRVVRLPMPHNQDDLWRTYTNGLFANGLLLVPHYPGADTAGQRSAMATFRSLLPGWEVRGIDAGKLIAREGALRCITMHVPRDDVHSIPPGPGK